MAEPSLAPPMATVADAAATASATAPVSLRVLLMSGSLRVGV
jgi:hypothetical protein